MNGTAIGGSQKKIDPLVAEKGGQPDKRIFMRRDWQDLIGDTAALDGTQNRRVMCSSGRGPGLVSDE